MNFHGKLIGAGILLFVVLACNLSANNNQKPTNTGGDTTEPKVLGEFTNRLKMVNKYVLVQKGLTDAQLIELAKTCIVRNLQSRSGFWTTTASLLR